MDIDHLTRLLSQVAQFKSMPLEEIKTFILAGTIQKFAREAMIFLEGDPCNGLFVLLEGQVHLCKHSPNGQVSIFAVFEPVIMFNEVVALDGGPNPATAVASADSIIWTLSAEQLQNFLLQHPAVSLGLLRVLANRNRRLMAQFQDLSFRPVPARAAKLLLEISQNGAQPINRQTHPNYQMAARIVTQPEAFSRSLQTFKKHGAIECTDKQIFILDAEWLAKTAMLTTS